MQLLQLVNQCCYRTGDTPVRSVFGNEDNALEWLGYISQACALIPQEHRWSMMKKDITFTTTGNKAEYDLPEDFDEMVTYNLYNLTNQRYINSASDDEELYKVATKNKSQSTIRFRIMGGKIVFTYPIVDGIDIRYTYMTKNMVKYKDSQNVTQYKGSFTDDADEFVLDDELLILKALALRSLNLGFPDAEQRERAYQLRLEMQMTKDGAMMKYSLNGEGFFNKTTPVLWSQI